MLYSLILSSSETNAVVDSCINHYKPMGPLGTPRASGSATPERRSQCSTAKAAAVCCSVVAQ